ncbi:hypothetical protein [Rhodospirillum centenum]|uniref:Uncharacterized protein n=1 Tax=Rhodospirillum centenum (strain ATCC 51521 / SW) TaxID=414684 RepID=B6ISD9_RHOCS|nr:hypothetical protein [Rhodospirillum centenum]ACI98375.1 conserved hypothetical protein [Rhodospirillum centenum SW]
MDSTAPPPPDVRPFEFRWLAPDGSRTCIVCYARTESEAEESARRAGWPGHDGTRLGRFRAWLKQELRR